MARYQLTKIVFSIIGHSGHAEALSKHLKQMGLKFQTASTETMQGVGGTVTGTATLTVHLDSGEEDTDPGTIETMLPNEQSAGFMVNSLHFSYERRP